MKTFAPATKIKSEEVNDNFSECATKVGVETLTNKTLTTPAINDPVFSAGAIIANALATGAFVTWEKTLTEGSFATSSASNVDITNLGVTFTPPSDGMVVGIVTACITQSNSGGYGGLGISIGGVDQANNVQFLAGANNDQQSITTFGVKAVSSGVAVTIQGRGYIGIGGTATYNNTLCHIIAVFIPKATLNA